MYEALQWEAQLFQAASYTITLVSAVFKAEIYSHTGHAWLACLLNYLSKRSQQYMRGFYSCLDIHLMCTHKQEV